MQLHPTGSNSGLEIFIIWQYQDGEFPSRHRKNSKVPDSEPTLDTKKPLLILAKGDNKNARHYGECRAFMDMPYSGHILNVEKINFKLFGKNAEEFLVGD